MVIWWVIGASSALAVAQAINVFAQRRSEPKSLMETVTNKRWLLKSRPSGMFDPSCLSMETQQISAADLTDGEILVQVDTLSCDAFIRTMLDETAYHGSVSLGQQVPAIGYGTVVASKSRKYRPGAQVTGMLGAQTFARLSTSGAFAPQPLMKLPGVPKQASLGLLGLTTGITAWVGVNSVLKPPKKGEVVVVTAAAGAVGIVAVQLLKRTGATVIAVAGGERKCSFLRDTYGVTTVDYKAGDVGGQLDKLAPDGVDYMYDNVGGEILDAVLFRLRPKARVVICGAASQYNGNLNVGTVRGPSEYLKLAERGATMKGFNVMQYFSSLPRAIVSLLLLHWRGKVRLPEQVESGIEVFPQALHKMFNGGHIGKLLVKVGSPEGTAVG